MLKNFTPVVSLLTAARSMDKNPSSKRAQGRLKTALRGIDAQLDEQDTFGPEIAQAREKYESDDLEFDDEPVVARTNKGTWVSCWAWVPDSDDESEDNEPEDEQNIAPCLRKR